VPEVVALSVVLSIIRDAAGKVGHVMSRVRVDRDPSMSSDSSSSCRAPGLTFFRPLSSPRLRPDGSFVHVARMPADWSMGGDDSQVLHGSLSRAAALRRVDAAASTSARIPRLSSLVAGAERVRRVGS